MGPTGSARETGGVLMARVAESIGPVGRLGVWIWRSGRPAWRRTWRVAAPRARTPRGGGGGGRVEAGGGGIRADEGGRGGAEGPDDGVVDVGADLVAGGSDGGAEA